MNDFRRASYSMNGRETFSSRFGMLVAGLGMAIGTGNMWRFPRIIAQNGGAVFLIPWFIFLFTWSLPLLIAEFGIGRAARRGVIGAFAHLFGRGYAWMGGFIAVTSVMILFYYSVVTGWTLKYALGTLTGQITDQQLSSTGQIIARRYGSHFFSTWCQ